MYWVFVNNQPDESSQQAKFLNDLQLEYFRALFTYLVEQGGHVPKKEVTYCLADLDSEIGNESFCSHHAHESCIADNFS